LLLGETSIPIKEEKQHHGDTDSDSGISVATSSNSPRPTTVKREPLTTKEQDQPLPNYTAMVQEAILALTWQDKKTTNIAEGSSGCSLLGIFLYILHNYPLLESVTVMNTKIRSTLALLNRMGIVARVGNGDDEDELECVSALVVQQPALSSSSSTTTTSGSATKDHPPVKKVTSKKEEAAKKEALKKKVAAAKLVSKKAKVLAGHTKKKKQNNVVTKSATTTKKGGKENEKDTKNFPFHLQKPKKLSPSLAAVCGKMEMSRHEAVKMIWIYIKKHQLQDPQQRSVIVCDDKMKAVTKKKRVTCAEVLTCLGHNMSTI
jgi:upstream activation factor subunit UAF30